MKPPRPVAASHCAPVSARSLMAAPLLALAVLLAPFALPVATSLTPGATGAAQAQSPFSAALYVNDTPITHYEIDQRMRFIEFVGASGGGDLRERAREALIEDILQRQEARRLGLRASNDDIRDGMSEFASRAELSADEMLDRLREAGIDADTFREFIHSGVLWRELVNARYGPDLRVTDAQIDQALSVAAVRPVTEILISELFLPSDPQFADAVNQLIPQIERLRTIEEFAEAARQVSAAPSREQDGRVERWIPIEEAPEPIAAAFAESAVGTIIGPIEFPGAYAFFQLRSRRDTREVPPGQTEYEYRRVGLPGGRSPENEARLARIHAGVDGCADLGPLVAQVAPELPEGAVATITRNRNEIDSATAAELGRMNPGQVSGNLVQSDELVVLMLCNRRVIADPPPSRSQVRRVLFNRALESRSEVYLQQLRAEAEIRTP